MPLALSFAPLLYARKQVNARSAIQINWAFLCEARPRLGKDHHEDTKKSRRRQMQRLGTRTPSAKASTYAKASADKTAGQAARRLEENQKKVRVSTLKGSCHQPRVRQNPGYNTGLAMIFPSDL